MTNSVLAPKNAYFKLRELGGPHNFLLLNPHSVWTECGVTFYAVHAEHSDNHAAGFIIDDQKKTYYISGDTLYNYDVIDDVLDYAVRLVSGTHAELDDAPAVTKKYIRYGASPRAAQALITCAKVRALMNGNYNVSYADIEALALPVLRHRIKINYSAINDKLGVDDVIGMLIKETKRK